MTAIIKQIQNNHPYIYFYYSGIFNFIQMFFFQHDDEHQYTNELCTTGLPGSNWKIVNGYFRQKMWIDFYLNGIFIIAKVGNFI